MADRMTSMAIDGKPRTPLTAIERAVLQRLAAGHTNAQIGQHLGRSEKTVRNQLTRVYSELGVSNRAQAVAAHMRMEFGGRW